MSRIHHSADARVAFFLSSLRMGGAERMMVHLATATAKLGVAVDLVVADATGGRQVSLPDNIAMHDLRVGNVRSALFPLASYLRHTRPYALVSRVNKTNFVAVAAARLSGSPVRIAVTEATHFSGWVGETHGLSRLKVSWGWLPLMRWSYPQADVVVAVSDGVADELSRHVPISRDQIRVIRNPVVHDDLLRMARETPSHPWLAEGRSTPVIVAVGSLRPAKDYPTLLRAFQLLTRRRKSRLIIYGEGSERCALLQLARELDLASSVDFPGNTRNPYAAMSACDLFVLSSRREGAPNVLVEAIVCGSRVVATDCPSGPREILLHGELGGLVPAGDAVALAHAMDQQLDAARPRPQARHEIRHTYDSRVAAMKYLAALGHPRAMRMAA